MIFSQVHSTHLAAVCPQALSLALLRRHIATGELSWAEKASRAREFSIHHHARTP